MLRLRALVAKVPPPLVGLGQIGIFLALIYLASFGGILLGFLPPAFIIGGNGVANLLTRTR